MTLTTALSMNKIEKYELLYEQVKALINKESDIIANMANVAAIIHETFNFWWTGFYRVIDNELVLGPFQGPLACSRISYGRGQTSKKIIVGQGRLYDTLYPIRSNNKHKKNLAVPISSKKKQVRKL